ncbi:MAG: hypothetical protein MUC65_04975 [Pontiellaceae bacterium]|nr:hypothetical protein [Pontiellaceae bacterium]
MRDSAIYLLFYTIFGAAWLGAGIFLLRGIGFYPCDDAIERNNPAAAVAVCLSFVGLAECYAGANIGDGPGWWCVLFAGGLATFVWLCLLSMYQAVGRVAEEVTVERNMNSAIRFGGFAIAAGFVCGRGAAGDWTSAQQTIIEFFDVWPLLGLIVIACFTEHFASAGYRDGQRIENRHQSPVPAFLCAWFYIATAIVTVLFFIPPIP